MNWVSQMFSQQYEGHLESLNIILKNLELEKLGSLQYILIEDDAVFLPEKISGNDFYGICLQAFTKIERHLFYLIYTRHEDVYLREEAWRYLLRDNELAIYSYPFIYKQAQISSKLSRQLLDKVDIRTWNMFIEENQ